MNHIMLASVSVLAMAALPAAAQGIAQEAAQGDNPAVLEEIVVTAQRVAESAQRTPIAIAVVDPRRLVELNVTRAEDLTRAVPALIANASGGPNTSYFVRGVGSNTVNSYSDPAISFNYDGVYIGRPNATQGFFYDLQRIEVLKGPQGTVYGRNATGGAINVIPIKPKLGETSGTFQANYGNYETMQAQGGVNLPLGDKAALRVSGALNKRDGFYSDGTGDQNELALRGQLLVELTPSLTTRFGVDYSQQKGIGSGSYTYGTFGQATPTSPFTFTPIPQLGPAIGVHDPLTDAFVQTRFIAQAGKRSEAVGTYPRQNNSVWGITNETNWVTGAGTLTVQAAYRESYIDSLSTTSNFRSFIIDEQSNQLTLEARFAGSVGESLDFLVGAFLLDEAIENSTAINQLTTLPIQTYDTGTVSKAVFGRLAWHATETLTLTAAGRYTDDRKYMNGLSDIFVLFCGPPGPPQDQCPTVPLMPVATTADQIRAFYTARGVAFGPPGSRGPNTPTILNNQIRINSVLGTERVTYRFAADWQASPDNLLYASYETGFHAGGFNFARGLETFQPESIRAFTIGSKNRFLDNRLQINIEGFYWKYKDQQIAQFGFDLGTPPLSVFFTSNVGSSTVKGVDIDVDYLLTPTTRFTGSVQYLDNIYDDFLTFTTANSVPNTNCPLRQGTNASGVAATVVDCSGKRGLFSPKWSINVNLEQTIKLDSYNLVLRGGTRYRGNFLAATTFQPWVISPAGFQSDASVSYGPASNRWYIQAYVNNIEDERRLTQSNLNNALGTQSGLATAPRTYGVRIGGRF